MAAGLPKRNTRPKARKESIDKKAKVKEATSSPSRSRLAGPVIDINTPLPDPKEFVHPHFLQMFTEVQNIQDWRVATILFWSSTGHRGYGYKKDLAKNQLIWAWEWEFTGLGKDRQCQRRAWRDLIGVRDGLQNGGF
jgi:hypothetical protein